ncbi:hypothetical protein EG68_07749 [Paragonimus skrjabini miyazakii]|uniref:AAA+ ATPase domain-containing protein n=1 Tax=Paragonimus skrjabini miyazakii TaxID=59628 RepID=A0A8S9YBH7_9TREM|nr:hypothetical protein EG68_07749 [Paragonimus skrjabini miyazakii]
MLTDGSSVSSDGMVDASASVSVKVACIRRHFFQQEEHHRFLRNLGYFNFSRSDHLALDGLLTDYVRLVDDMKGLNNFADTSLTLASGCRNGTGFSCCEDTIEPALDTNSLPVCRLIGDVLTIGDSKTLLGEPLVQPPIETSPCKLETGLLTADAPPNFISRPGLKRSAQSLTPPPIQSVVSVDSELSKRPNFDKHQPIMQANSPFRTAGAVLQQNIHSKQTDNHRSLAAGYGSSRRTLGGRRGPSHHFVPPVPSGPSSATNSDPPDFSSSSVSQSKEDGPPLGDERLRQFDQKTVDMIMSEIMGAKSQVTWDDIAGLEFQKKTLQEVVILPMLRPDLFTGLRGPPKGLLLFGPPGTGKTLIGRCIASQSNSTFFSISASSLTSKWVGEGEKMVRALFAIARIHQPAVIFIDEVDSLLTQRSETEHESSRRIKTEFLVQLDGVATGQDERLLFVGATNRPQELDEAARRRFVKRLYIPLPDLKARTRIVENLLRQQRHRLAATDFAVVAQRTKGYSGADMANLCREAAMGPIRSLSLEAIQSIACDEVRPVELSDFEAALSQVRASVSTGDLEHYLKWNKQYGSFEA